MLGRVRAGVRRLDRDDARPRLIGTGRQCAAAGIAELLVAWIRGAATRTLNGSLHRRRAVSTETRARRIGMTAGWTVHCLPGQVPAAASVPSPELEVEAARGPSRKLRSRGDWI